MTVQLKSIPKAQELHVDDVMPVVANVKYAQRAGANETPAVANVKYAQRADADAPPAVANVKGRPRRAA